MTYLIRQIFPLKAPRSLKKICTIERLFPSNKYLLETYKLKLSDRILVQHTRKSNSKYHWKGYRTKWKHIFTGSVEYFEIFCRDIYKDIWEKRRNSHDTKK